MPTASEEALLALLGDGDDTDVRGEEPARDVARSGGDAADVGSSSGREVKSEKKKDRREKKEKRKAERRERRKHKSSAGTSSKFVDDAADESDEDGLEGAAEEDDDGDDSMAAAGDEEEDDGNVDYILNHKVNRQFFGADEDESAEAMAAKLEAKYKAERNQAKAAKAARAELGDTGRGGRTGSAPFRVEFTQAMLPQPSDPKVYAVKCRPGTARSLVARIVNKCYAYRMGFNHEKRKIDLGVISAFSVDHVKEWVYIESHRELFVRNAVNGLEGLFRFNIVQVAPEELMQLMARQYQKKDALVANAYARVKNGPYRRDLCQVVRLVEDGRRALVRLVPREDFVQKPFLARSARDTPKDALQLPQRFFVPALAVGARARGGEEGGYEWGDLRFDAKGYLLKEIGHRSLQYGSKLPKPSVQELTFYHQHDPVRVGGSLAVSTIADVRKVEFQLGDTVRVARGQLAGVTGRITDLSVAAGRAKLFVTTSVGGGGMVLTAELAECVKHFPEGSHVLVESGKWAGDSGTVIKNVGDVLVYLTDHGFEEKEARSNDCRQTTIVSAGSHTLATWKLFDLVLLDDGETAAVIVKLVVDQVVVLSASNETKTVRPANIKQTVRGKQSALDAFDNQVPTGSEIVVQPPHRLAGCGAKVISIFHSTVFAHAPTVVSSNAGIFAVPAASVVVRGGRNKARPPGERLPAPPYVERAPYPARLATRQPAPRTTASAQWQPEGATVPWGATETM